MQEKQAAKNIPSRDNMGLGLLSSPELIFVRQFRFTLGNEYLNENFVKSVNFDFKNQTMNIEIYEVYHNEKINIHEWLARDLSKEKLIFTTYDGCGNVLYRYIFVIDQLLSSTAAFDMESNEVSIRKMCLQFSSYELQSAVIPKNSLPVWKMSVNEGEEYEVVVEKRPSTEMPSTSIDFLNTKGWLPAGLTYWKPIEISIPPQSKIILKELWTNPNIKLTYYSEDAAPEVWHLDNISVQSVGYKERQEEFTVVKLIYDNAHLGKSKD